MVVNYITGLKERVTRKTLIINKRLKGVFENKTICVKVKIQKKIALLMKM